MARWSGLNRGRGAGGVARNAALVALALVAAAVLLHQEPSLRLAPTRHTVGLCHRDCTTPPPPCRLEHRVRQIFRRVMSAARCVVPLPGLYGVYSLPSLCPTPSISSLPFTVTFFTPLRL